MTLQQVHTPADFNIEPGETCLTALMDTAKKRPHGVMFTRPANYEWVNVTGKEFINEVFEVAQGLIALGVEQGDRIALISATRYEWSLLDYAIWAAGAASVPVYPPRLPPRCAGLLRIPGRCWRLPKPVSIPNW